ncbi:hypothetical protein LLG96_15400 [bacterium]|nr:hypothetical protein [bacterium]
MKHGVMITAFLMCFIYILPEGRCGSLYSANGLGIVLPDDVGRAKALGGAGIAVGDGINMMRGNPALLASFSSPSYGFSAVYDNAKTFTGGTERPVYAKTNFNLLKFVLPIRKGIVIGWGLSPFSRTDAIITLPKEPDSQYQDEMKTRGGINISTIGIAGTVKNRVSFGVALNYHFGTIEEDWKRTFPADSGLNTATDYLKKKYKGYSTTFGILVNPYKTTYIGIGYTTQTDLTMNAVLHPGDSLDPEVPILTKKTRIPSIFRMGVSSLVGTHLMATFDYSYEKWENAAKTEKEKEMYNDSIRFGGGVRYKPSNKFNAPYYLTVPVSAGFRYGTLYYKSYPEIDTVTEKALTFGLEFPLKKNIGKLISSFEYGVRGDKDKNGWDETFYSFSLSLIGKIK